MSGIGEINISKVEEIKQLLSQGIGSCEDIEVNNFDDNNLKYDIAQLYFDDNLRHKLKAEDLSLFSHFIKKANFLIDCLDNNIYLNKDFKTEKYNDIQEKVLSANSLNLILSFYNYFENEIYKIKEGIEEYAVLENDFIDIFSDNEPINDNELKLVDDFYISNNCDYKSYCDYIDKYSDDTDNRGYVKSVLQIAFI